MHFAFNFPLEKIIFWKNIIRCDKSWSFLLIIWDKENEFFLLIIRNRGSILYYYMFSKLTYSLFVFVFLAPAFAKS